MRIAGLAVAIVALFITTGCQPPQQRLATHVTAERLKTDVEPYEKPYQIDVDVERLDQKGNVVEKLADERFLSPAGGRVRMWTGWTEGQDEFVDGLVIDIFAPAEGKPQVVMTTTTLREKGAILYHGMTETPVLEPASPTAPASPVPPTPPVPPAPAVPPAAREGNLAE
jgi:hypothetical protein